MTAPTAAATATIAIIEALKRFCMVVSSFLRSTRRYPGSAHLVGNSFLNDTPIAHASESGRIERRSCSFFDAQRRSCEQKLETTRPPRLLGRSPRRSEIRFVGLRNRMEILIEVIRLILRANYLHHRRLVLAPCLFKCERPVERVGIFHRYDRGQRPAVLADREPLDDVEFLGVRRAERIDVVILAACEPDRIDHERVPALVVADGFAEPGRLHIFRMFVGEINAAHELIALPYHPNLLQRLDEIHGLEKQELARTAPSPAAGLK